MSPEDVKTITDKIYAFRENILGRVLSAVCSREDCLYIDPNRLVQVHGPLDDHNVIYLVLDGEVLIGKIIEKPNAYGNGYNLSFTPEADWSDLLS